MKVKLTQNLDPELRMLGLNPGDEIEVTPDPASKVGVCHFTIYHNVWPSNCSIWPDSYEKINQ